MIFHENLLTDDSHGKTVPYFIRKLGKMLQNFSSAAVVIGALRVNDPDLMLLNCSCILH